MFTEAFVSILLEVAITGAGLILAIYALVSPILDKIINVRKELIAGKKKQFDDLAEKIKTERSEKNMKELNKLNDALTELVSFPNYLGIGVLLVFMLYIFSSFFAYQWFTQPQNAKPAITEDALTITFLSATAGFLLVGLYTISEVARTMGHEWKKLEEEKAKAEETSGEELAKLRKDIENLKRTSAEESLKPKFSVVRFQEESNKPVKSSWSIRILHPDRPIEKCTVTYSGIKLPWWDKPDEFCYEEFIDTMSGGNVRISKGMEKEDAEVIVKDGKKIIWKKKFKDIPVVDKYITYQN